LMRIVGADIQNADVPFAGRDSCVERWSIREQGIRSNASDGVNVRPGEPSVDTDGRLESTPWKNVSSKLPRQPAFVGRCIEVTTRVCNVTVACEVQHVGVHRALSKVLITLGRR